MGYVNMEDSLNVNEIFTSISGEVGGAFPQGSVVTFIRLQGCNLKCPWCFGVRAGRRIPRIILSRHKNKKITDVTVGDNLMTFDADKNLVETTVSRVIKREVDSWLQIRIDGTLYFVTEEHPFFTTKGIRRADELVVGDLILHATFQQKISLQKQLENPMHDPEVCAKSTKNTDYKKVGTAISKAVLKKKKEGTYICAWDTLTDIQKMKVREKISVGNSGAKNGNWKGGAQKNYEALKKQVTNRQIQHCAICGKYFPDSIPCKKNNGIGLDVHHIDGDNKNDAKNNLQVVCESCHYSLHATGFNFWNGSRTDGKEMQAQNGFVVEATKKIDRNSFPPSTRPKPLLVYNLSCFPYNSYLVDNMWVHNCDTKQSISTGCLYLMSIDDILPYIKSDKVLITGGEPLIQKPMLTRLLNTLLHKNLKVQVETNGSLEIEGSLCCFAGTRHISWVIDRKLFLDESEKTFYARHSIVMGNSHTVIKYAVESRKQLPQILKEIRRQHEYFPDCTFAISPIITKGELISYADILNLICTEHMEDCVMVNTQLHKFLNLP